MTKALSLTRLLQAGLLTALIFGSTSILNLERVHAAPRSQGSISPVVNINHAGTEDLETVRGIGPSLAVRIVNYREENDGFDSLEDLTNVRGIGQAKLQKIKSQVTL